MKVIELVKDPYNVVLTGVGGQGNVIASRMLGNIFARKGYYITIGETFGASQRGGSVMSHLRISLRSIWSPQIPKGKADLIVALEPIEALRVIAAYGKPGVKVLSNTRPVHTVGVIAGDQAYPSLDELKTTLAQLTDELCFVEATDEALKLGKPILSSVIMLGAIAGLKVLPFDTADFREVAAETLKGDNLEMNVKVFDLGKRLAGQGICQKILS
jgi:indolepyruvate ferredoxin oxidoreductase, beta subunit